MRSKVVVGLEGQTVVFSITSGSGVSYRTQWPAHGGTRPTWLGGHHYCYKVYASLVGGNGKREPFTFHDSPRRYEDGLDYERHVLALKCFVSDAIDSTYNYAEFCDACGYDPMDSSSRRTYKMCVVAGLKLDRIGFDGDLYDLHHALVSVYSKIKDEGGG